MRESPTVAGGVKVIVCSLRSRRSGLRATAVQVSPKGNCTSNCKDVISSPLSRLTATSFVSPGLIEKLSILRLLSAAAFVMLMKANNSISENFNVSPLMMEDVFLFIFYGICCYFLLSLILRRDHLYVAVTPYRKNVIVRLLLNSLCSRSGCIIDNLDNCRNVTDVNYFVSFDISRIEFLTACFGHRSDFKNKVFDSIIVTDSHNAVTVDITKEIKCFFCSCSVSNQFSDGSLYINCTRCCQAYSSICCLYRICFRIYQFLNGSFSNDKLFSYILIISNNLCLSSIQLGLKSSNCSCQHFIGCLISLCFCLIISNRLIFHIDCVTLKKIISHIISIRNYDIVNNDI